MSVLCSVNVQEDCETNIERWMFNLYIMKTSTKPLTFQDIMPVFKTVASKSEFNNMSEREQRRYMRLLDIYRTNLSALKYSRAEDKLEERYKNAKAHKENGVPVAIISASLDLSAEEVEKL